MMDTGYGGELSLPARKILQMGLNKLKGTFGEIKVKGANNVVGIKYVFDLVGLSISFTRAGVGSETRECAVAPTCWKDDYENAVAGLASVPVSTVAAPDSPPSTSTTVLSDVIELSPVAHRPPGKENESVAIGMGALNKLGVNINCQTRLEIEEEFVLLEE